MRKLKNLLLGLVSAFSLSSCGLLGTEEGLYIQDVIVENLDDGSKKVSIVFTDEDVPTVTFTIPKGDKGDQGPEGIGIASIESEEAKDGSGLVITITYTDPTLDPSIWEIPNANSIESFSSSYDEETGLTTITFLTSDGEEHAFALPQGKDGVGISSVSQTTENNGDIVITITYTDPTVKPTEIRLPYKNGQDGRGIDYIESTSDAEYYYLIIHYTDGTVSDPLAFPVPQVKDGTKWYTGSGNPNRADIRDANNGDFYFDYATGSVYMYQSRTWSLLFSMGENPTMCTVTFDAATNGGWISFPESFAPRQEVQFGHAIDDIPIASKENASFIGWYSYPDGPSDPRSTKITDMTPITKTCTVYACFEEATE